MKLVRNEKIKPFIIEKNGLYYIVIDYFGIAVSCMDCNYKPRIYKNLENAKIGLKSPWFRIGSFSGKNTLFFKEGEYNLI